MTTFPALVPADAIITPGAIPATVVAGYDGSTVATTADAMATGDTLTLPFRNLTEAQANSVRNHQRDQQGRSFGFDAVTLAPSLTPAGYLWVYADDPQQEDIRSVADSELYFGTCTFRAVRVRVALPPTANSRIELRPYAARALPAGPPGASSTLQLTPTAAGVVTTPPGDNSFLLLRPTAAGVVDLNSYPLDLFLAMEGVNNSTQFIDSGSSGVTVTANGNARISTARSSVGSSSGLFNRGNDYLLISSASAIQVSGDFTIRTMIYPESTQDMVIASSSVDFNTQALRINEEGLAGSMSAYINATQVFTAIPAGVTVNEWQELAICRKGSVTQMFRNQTPIGSPNTSWTGAFTINVIGTFFYNGEKYSLDYGVKGSLDQFQIWDLALYL